MGSRRHFTRIRLLPRSGGAVRRQPPQEGGLHVRVAIRNRSAGDHLRARLGFLRVGARLSAGAGLRANRHVSRCRHRRRGGRFRGKRRLQRHTRRGQRFRRSRGRRLGRPGSLRIPDGHRQLRRLRPRLHEARQRRRGRRGHRMPPRSVFRARVGVLGGIRALLVATGRRL